MNNTEFKKKKADDIVFKMRGGELLVWKFKGESSKLEPMVSVFLGTEFDSEEGGLCYSLMVEGEPKLVPCERFVLWDNLTQYED